MDDERNLGAGGPQRADQQVHMCHMDAGQCTCAEYLTPSRFLSESEIEALAGLLETRWDQQIVPQRPVPPPDQPRPTGPASRQVS